MSWETNKITVVSALTTLGYKEVPRDIDIEDKIGRASCRERV